MWIRFWAHGHRVPYSSRTEMYFWRDEEPDKVLLKDELDEWAAQKMMGSEHYHYGKEVLRRKKLPDAMRERLVAHHQSSIEYAEKMLAILRSGR
jgi:hypothetical protein